MEKCKRKKFFLLLAVFIFSAPLLIDGSPDLFVSQSNRLKTLSSFKKIDDFPLYVMWYYGDYHFIDVLKRGIRRDGAWACTCFKAISKEDGSLMGRNFDWEDHPALLLFTDPPDGYASVSMVDIFYLGYNKKDIPKNNPGSLFTAPHIPFDGMNEHGLAIGMMAVQEADPPRDSGKVTISSLNVIRLMLDYAKNVEEALSLIAEYNIDFTDGPPLHYLIADAAGDSVVVEFVDRQMKVIRSEKPWQVSTNFIISDEKPGDGPSGCRRYNKVWQKLTDTGGRISQEEALGLLKIVSQVNTIWSIVYDQKSLTLDVVMGKKFDKVHHFSLK
jgi:hypothetical protein